VAPKDSVWGVFSSLSALVLARAKDAVNPSQTPNSKIVTNGCRGRVLIVDDEPDQATMLGKLLKMRGYLIQVVTDSMECLRYLESFQPDVLLLDLAMPKISGYELAKQIRAQGKFETIAVIAMSGYADHQHTQWSLEAGCDQHLVKPMKLDTLEAAISNAVEKRLRVSNSVSYDPRSAEGPRQ
jgi:CheY-like chemotaxis protein